MVDPINTNQTVCKYHFVGSATKIICCKDQKMSKDTKKLVIKFFKELYNRKPTKEELQAFIECMKTKKGKD